MSTAEEAAKRLALAQKGGIRGMAAQMSMNENLLYHKLDASRPEHLTLAEAEQMTALSGRPDIAKALASGCGHICVPVGLLGEVTDDSLMSAFTATCKEMGDIAGDLNQFLVDGQISLNEEKRLDRQCEELIQAAVELRRRIHAKAAADAVKFHVVAR
jgi:hypothetical protein